MMQEKKTVRCAIYTRKSTDEGLDQEFNSLDAQREAGEAYITSQRHEGWQLIETKYDDGGFSGGSLERPGLKALLADIAMGKIDVVVVYKIDRLTRSLNDFASIIKVFDQHNATFVSVTQQFNTTTSMGRLTLNILLSFAQFERETISERTRDKYAASRRKGMWMGGCPPLGYEVKDRKLVPHAEESALIRIIFEQYLAQGSLVVLAQYLREHGYTSRKRTTKSERLRGGRDFSKSSLYNIFNNRIYLGEVTYKDHVYPGEHQAIITQELWDKVHARLAENSQERGKIYQVKGEASLLKGLVFAENGYALTPSYTKRRGKLYRYYTSVKAIKHGFNTCTIRNVAAAELEGAVIGQLRKMLSTPELVFEVYCKARTLSATPIRENAVGDALRRLDEIWDQLFPLEQRRLVRLLIHKVIVAPTGVRLQLNADGVRMAGLEMEPQLEVACA
jgi:DNA invertase Pin-like site-specific DNA recombinase